MSTLYFDHNATTPLCDAARAAWLDATDRHWHNPSSLYPDAGAAKQRLEDARQNLADLLGAASPERIVFTSGATESNNAVVAAVAAGKPEGVAVASAMEHPSVLAPVRRHFGERGKTIALEEFDREIADAGLVAVMAANNETGTVLADTGHRAAARERGALFLCDASQWFGKLPVDDIHAMGDVVVGSAHKFGGPKGTGFAVLSEAATDVVLQTGGPQESGQRAGTEDLAGIVAMVAALEDALANLPGGQAAHRDTFERDLAERIPGTFAVAADRTRLPNTSMLVMPAGRNLKWLTRLGRRGVAISTGSACSSGAECGSHVLAALGLPPEEIDRALRISSGPATTASDWSALTTAMVDVWDELGGTDKPTLDLGAL